MCAACCVASISKIPSASLLWMFSQPQFSPMFPFSVLLTARVWNVHGTKIPFSFGPSGDRLIQRAQNKKASMKRSFSIARGCPAKGAKLATRFSGGSGGN